MEHNEEPQQTPESVQLEIERERRKRAEIEHRTLREKKDLAEKIEDTKKELFEQNFRRQIAAAGLKFNPSDAELRVMIERKRPDAKLLVTNDGQFSLEIAGKQADFGEFIIDFAVAHPFLLVDRGQIADRLKSQHELSWEDFPDAASKARAISEKGLSWWESLSPTRREIVTKASVTKEAYLRMTTRQKLALGLSEDELSRLLHRGQI